MSFPSIFVCTAKSNSEDLIAEYPERAMWGGAGAYPSGHRVRGGVHPRQVASP